jgi:hypothetical protein
MNGGHDSHHIEWFHAQSAHNVTRTMTYPALLIAFALFVGTLAGIYKGYEAPRADVRAMCSTVKKQDHRGGEVCKEYGYRPE